jgi:hypothetical protein
MTQGLLSTIPLPLSWAVQTQQKPHQMQQLESAKLLLIAVNAAVLLQRAALPRA